MEGAQRQAALAVRRVLDGGTLGAALTQEAAAAGEDPAGGRRHALVQELAYGTLRHWGTLDALTRRLVSKPLSDPLLPCLVAVALYQLQHTRAPSFAIVNHAVDNAAAMVRPAAKALVNALLRRYLRERAALDESVRADPVARWSYPGWWIDRLRADYPDDWQGILEAGNERPPLALRANARVTSRDALLARFAAAGVGGAPVGAAGIIVAPPRAVAELPGFADGAFSVQDAGAQLAAPLLCPERGMRVLDACAAPGGKTTHLAELADVDIVALDSDAERLARVRENVARLPHGGARIVVAEGDAGAPATWWDGRPFDLILADVPCTASGVVRRHPDAKWLRRESDIGSFARQQARLLASLWPCLARGGRMLYATCSVFRDENEAQVDAFMVKHADALREILTFAPDVAARGGQLLPSLPGAGHNQDGFFYALLGKG
jgi:16S rRNA (cytosine967-C5)-methyltransferase